MSGRPLQEAQAAQAAAAAAAAQAAALQADLATAQQELNAACTATEEQRQAEQHVREELALVQQGLDEQTMYGEALAQRVQDLEAQIAAAEAVAAAAASSSAEQVRAALLLLLHWLA